MKIVLPFTPEEETELNNYLQQRGIDVTAFIMEVIYDKFEDEFDLVAATKALRQHRANPTTYSLNDVIERTRKSK